MTGKMFFPFNKKYVYLIMGSINSLSIIGAIFTIIMIVSGIWLRKKGEPYNTAIFTIHKISVIALIVLIVMIFIRHARFMSFEGLGLVFSIVTGLFIIIAFVSGALLSIEKTARNFLKIVHKGSSVLALVMIPVIWLYCH